MDARQLVGKPRRWLPIAILVALMAVELLPFVLTSATMGDEFTALGYAWRVARGESLYRDCFDLIAPMSRWLLAGVLVFTGPSLLAARLFQATLLVLCGCQLYGLARRLGAPTAVALLPGLVMVPALYRLLPIYSHHWIVLPFELAALQLGVAALGGAPRWCWFGAGLATAMALLCLQSDGLVLAVALATTPVVAPLAMGRPWRAGVLDLVAWATGLALPLAAAAAALLSQGAWTAAVDDVWRWPLTHYRTAGGVNDIRVFTDLSVMTSVMLQWVNLPYWYMRAYYSLYLLGIAPLMVLLGGAWALELAWRRVRSGHLLAPHQAQLALVVLVATGDLVLATRGRADSIHVGLYAVPALLLAAVLAWRLAARATAPGFALIRWLPMASLLGFGLAGMLQLAHQLQAEPGLWLQASSPDARLMATPAIRYLRDHGKPGDRQIAFPFGEVFGFYAMPPAGSYNEMLPPEDGYHTEAEYHDFWAQLLARRPRFVIYQPTEPDAQVHARYFRYPLTGYHLVFKGASPLGPDAYIYERHDRP